MSRSKRSPLLHRGIKARRVYPRAQIHRNVGRETDRASSPESGALMLDLFTILEFDPNVQYFQRQPVTINHTDKLGNQSSFEPEFLITYRRDIEPACFMKPLLCDVMVRADALQKCSDFQDQIRAAKDYARGRDWRYQILTEREIRTPYLENARLLLPCYKLRADSEYDRVMLSTLDRLGEIKVEVLLNACSKTHTDTVKLWNSLYQLVAFGRIGTNLRTQFNMQSIIWCGD